jgi:hypothetical protein
MSRPRHRPDPALRRQVETLAGFGVAEPDIAEVIGVDPKTLRKHYRHELAHGHVKANAKVAESLYRKAIGDGPQSVTAAIFWLKTRARRKETSVQELVRNDRDDGALTVLIQRFSAAPGRERDREPVGLPPPAWGSGRLPAAPSGER